MTDGITINVPGMSSRASLVRRGSASLGLITVICMQKATTTKAIKFPGMLMPKHTRQLNLVINRPPNLKGLYIGFSTRHGHGIITKDCIHWGEHHGRCLNEHGDSNRGWPSSFRETLAENVYETTLLSSRSKASNCSSNDECLGSWSECAYR